VLFCFVLCCKLPSQPTNQSEQSQSLGLSFGAKSSVPRFRRHLLMWPNKLGEIVVGKCRSRCIYGHLFWGGEGRGGEARGGAGGWPTSNRPFWAQKYHASRVCCFLLRVKSLRQIFYLHWVAFTDCKSSSGISNADTSISLVLCSCPFLRSCFSTLQQRFKVLFLFPLPCKLRLQNCSSYYVASRGGINYWHIGTIEAFQVWHWGAQYFFYFNPLQQ